MPIPPYTPPLCFWIYGPMRTGKTVLARAICGPDTLQFGAFDDIVDEDTGQPVVNLTENERIEQLDERMKKTRRVIIDDYREDLSSKELFLLLLRAGLNQGFDFDRFVVISEQPPVDAAMISRFQVISTICTPKRPNSHDALKRL